MGIPIVLGACFCTHPLFFASLIFLTILLSCLEYKGLSRRTVPPILGVVLGLLAFQGLFAWRGLSVSTELSILAGAFLLGVAGAANNALRGGPASSEVGSLWIGAPLVGLAVLHDHFAGPDWWKWASPLLLVFLPLWAGDTAAIFAGKAWGRHPLAPSISPKKTIEGGVANLLAAVGVAWALGLPLHVPLLPSLGIGVLVGLFGQVGDLFESWLKRKVDVKDSGTLLPGHGGILDRIDSLLFVSLPVALVLVATWTGR